jgi:hypothetical protein
VRQALKETREKFWGSGSAPRLIMGYWKAWLVPDPAAKMSKLESLSRPPWPLAVSEVPRRPDAYLGSLMNTDHTSGGIQPGSRPNQPTSRS